MKDFFGRSPFVLLGAFGLLSLPSELVQWQEHLGNIIDGFRWLSSLVCYPLNAIGRALFGLELVSWAEKYLCLSFIFFGSLMRAILATYPDDADLPKHHPGNYFLGLLMSLVWPVTALMALWQVIQARNDNEAYVENQKTLGVFLESFIVALILIALNYLFVMAQA